MSEMGTVLVVGGGMAGLTAALEAAEAGYEVHLVERNPYLGGRVAQLHRYFPKMCPPYCGLEINFKRIKSNPKIHVFTSAEVVKLEGKPGDMEATIRRAPQMVTDACTTCGDCLAVCPVERDDAFNYDMGKTKAIYLPHLLAYPMHFAIDAGACKGAECGKCVPVCKPKAIDLAAKETTMTLKVGSVVMATGWQPYDARKLEGLGFGECANVITNVMMERLAAPNGPTGGKITRPSDGNVPRHVTFVQCAGSRDENHLPYCSAVCCLASLKQAGYVRDQVPESKVQVFYIDIRSPGRNEDVYQKVQADANVVFTRGKAAKISEIPGSKNLLVEAENTLTGERVKVETELVVLATGMQPTPGAGVRDENQFIVGDPLGTGIAVAGVCHKPADVACTVQDGTGAALRAIQATRRPAHA